MRGFPHAVSRRGFLSAGAATAGGVLLRGLDAEAANAPPTRLLVVHRPCGTRPEHWFTNPSNGRPFELGRILKPLERHKNDLIVFDGLDSPKSRVRIGADEHTVGLAMMMTGHQWSGAGGLTFEGAKLRDIGNAKSFDHVLVEQSALFQGTPVPSVSVLVNRNGGYYSGFIMSYSGPKQPIFPLFKTHDLYARLFGAVVPGRGGVVDAEALARARARKQSVIDLVRKDMARVVATAPASQRAKLDLHLQSIREVERQLDGPPYVTNTAACTQPTLDVTSPQTDAPSGPAYLDKGRLQFRMIKAAFQCDITRVALFQWSHTNSGVSFDTLLPEKPRGGHHSLSHSEDPAAYETLALIDTWYVERLAEFLDELKQTPEAGGTMLDNTVVVFLSEVAMGNHSHVRMPVLMAGRGGSRIKTGRLLNAGGRTMNDFWNELGRLLGMSMPFGDPRFGDGNFPSLAA